MRTVLVGIACLVVGYGMGQKGKSLEFQKAPIQKYAGVKKEDLFYVHVFNATCKTYMNQGYNEDDVYHVSKMNGFVIVRGSVSRKGQEEADIFDGSSEALLTESGMPIWLDPIYHGWMKDKAIKYKKQGERFKSKCAAFRKSLN